MNEQRRNRMAAAITVNVILLLVILVAVIIYQLVTIPLGANKVKRLNAELDYWQQKIEQSESDLEYLQSEQGIIDTLLELGYVFEEP